MGHPRRGAFFSVLDGIFYGDDAEFYLAVDVIDLVDLLFQLFFLHAFKDGFIEVLQGGKLLLESLL